MVSCASSFVVACVVTVAAAAETEVFDRYFLFLLLLFFCCFRAITRGKKAFPNFYITNENGKQDIWYVIYVIMCTGAHEETLDGSEHEWKVSWFSDFLTTICVPCVEFASLYLLVLLVVSLFYVFSLSYFISHLICTHRPKAECCLMPWHPLLSGATVFFRHTKNERKRKLENYSLAFTFFFNEHNIDRCLFLFGDTNFLSFAFLGS